jgi:hypothetical protein
VPVTTSGTHDQVHFEVADFAAAVRLTRRLGRAWLVSLMHEEQEVNVVTAAVLSEPSDLAALLREVEAWVEEESLCAIRYLLDGRMYVLEAGEADWAAHPWAAAGEA